MYPQADAFDRRATVAKSCPGQSRTMVLDGRSTSIATPSLMARSVNRQIPSRRQFTDFPRSFDTIDLRSL
jgi:hypothetical protein